MYVCLASLSEDLLLRCFTYLDLPSLAQCCMVCTRFHKLIAGDVRNQLWAVLLEREAIRWGTLPKTHRIRATDSMSMYREVNTAYYVLEFSLSNGRICLSVLPTQNELPTMLQQRVCQDDQRALAFNLLRNGLDVTLHNVYRGQIVATTPLYDHIVIQIGDEWLVRFFYLGGLDDYCCCRRDSDCSSESSYPSSLSSTSGMRSDLISSEEDPIFRLSCCEEKGEEQTNEQCICLRRRRNHIATTAASSVKLPDDQANQFVKTIFGDNGCSSTWAMSHTFYREGRRCRYQITAYKKVQNGSTDDSPPSRSQVSLTYPPTLFLDVMILNLDLTFLDKDKLPPLESAAFSLPPDRDQVSLTFDASLPPLRPTCFWAAMHRKLVMRPQLFHSLLMKAPYHHLKEDSKKLHAGKLIQLSTCNTNLFESL
eukprot:Protomagalhaensia_wolfi_Nauph_80__610@NODE_134_length_3496_cov_5_820364_g100_i0_p2_GENE_NODE_134_length_3496_cov_5_820364_g100_i0NODE_134_length_3496_cov_5_820364_g100_i0_p2_ORF_typecomplete_len424_score29_07Fbox/PF00646_33/5_5e08Fboxlike/PF12937_7/0_00034_NODE_134_length_3496_cov_5_820364_g100_i015702841